MSDAQEGAPEWMRRQLEDAVNDSRRALIDWEQKVTLSGAVGNGAGLVVVGGALINGWKLGLFLALLPAMWMFGAGLVLAATAPFIAMRGYNHGYLGTLARLGEYHNQPANHFVNTTGEQDPAVLLRKAIDRDRIAMGLVLASGGAFALGVVWPLAIVTFVH